jgi:hypothetical protein
MRFKMNCENCKEKHDGKYGSGRFCSAKCARGFSTKNKRKEINNKVSKKLKGRTNFATVSKGTEAYEKWKSSIAETWKNKNEKRKQEIMQNKPFCDWPRPMIWDRVFDDQDGKCRNCKNSHWMGELITLELEHIDGDSSNNKRENVELLCPNCHSLTPTWRGRNKAGRENIGRVSDEELKKALENAPSIRQALINVGLSPKGNNYARCKKILEK